MSSRTKVKVCGITNQEDAAAAAEAGADAVGFVFHRTSPRYIMPAVAKNIVFSLPPFVIPVGVFVNEEINTVRTIMDSCGLALAQLHGDETVSYCQELGRPVIKAIRVKDRGTFLTVAELQGRAGVRCILIDAYSENAYGGTGQSVDWELTAEVTKDVPILLAGGLTPENVAQAIRIVRPYGVDVSSGVESVPGKKDHAKIHKFIDVVRLVSQV